MVHVRGGTGRGPARAGPGYPLGVLLLVMLTAAHPSGHGPGAEASSPAVLGQRVALVIEGEGVVVDYTAEVPMRRLLQEGPAEVAPGTVAAGLAAGLHLTWGESPLVVVWAAPTARPGRGGFYDLGVQGRAALPGRTGRLALRNGNFPDEPGFYATAVTVPGDLVVTASSLARVQDGRVRDNRHGAWVKEESAREPWLELRPARFWEVREAAAPLPERMAGLAVLGPPWGWIAAAVGALLSAALGAWALRRARRAVPSP